MALAGVKVSFLEAAIAIVAPVDGLRPSRAGLSLTLNLPNLGRLVSAPLTAASAIALKTLSTMVFRLSLCQVVLSCDLFGDLIGRCHGTSSVLFRFCSSDTKAVEQIEPASQVRRLLVRDSVTAPLLGALQAYEGFDRLRTTTEGLHHGLATRADPAPIADQRHFSEQGGLRG